jgi:hypothetical protein
MNLRPSLTRLSILLAVLIAAGAAVAAYALASGSASPRAAAGSHARSRTAADVFGVFRRHKRRSDTITAGRSAKARAAVVRLDSRLVFASGTRKVFAVSRGSDICVVYQEPGLGGQSCSPLADASNPDTPVTLLLSAQQGPGTVIALMLDGVTSTRAVDASGQTSTVSVQNNLAIYGSQKPASLSWSGPDARAHRLEGLTPPAPPGT